MKNTPKKQAPAKGYTPRKSARKQAESALQAILAVLTTSDVERDVVASARWARPATSPNRWLWSNLSMPFAISAPTGLR